MSKDQIAQAKALIKRKSLLFKNLTSLQDAVKKKSFDDVKAEVILRSLSKYEEAFEKIKEEVFFVNEIVDQADKVGTSDFDTFEVIFDSLAEACVKVEFNAKKAQSAPPPASASHQLKVPPLSLPNFDGQISQWAEFKAQFTHIIDDSKSLSNVQKLTYLRNSLTSEPLSIVNQYEIVDASYPLAWADLIKRYDNKRRSVSFHLFKILQFKAQSQSKENEHVKFIETHRAATNAIKGLGINDLADALLFHLSFENLSLSDQKLFDREHAKTDTPTMKELLEFVEGIAMSEELRLDKGSKGAVSKPKVVPSNPKKSFVANARVMSCINCKGDHPLYRCSDLESLPISERVDKVKQLGCCVSCLYKHPNKQCTSRYACKLCGSKQHNTFLHDETPAGPSAVKTCNYTSSCNLPQVLLGTIQCRIKDNWGDFVTVRGVLDPGSEISIVSSALASRLGLPRLPATCEVQGISKTSVKTKGNLSIQLYGSQSSSIIHELEAVVLPDICAQLPRCKLSPDVRCRFEHLKLADPNFDQPGNVQLLLGCDVYGDLLSPLEPAFIPGKPSAINTKFGYVVMGRSDQISSPPENNPVSLRVISQPLDQAITQFWESEEVPKAQFPDPSDVFCENHFKETHSRDDQGRFVVRIPFLPDATPLGSNEKTAYSCLRRLENRLSRNPELNEKYQECLSEYITLNQMSPTNKKCTYLLPHHAVVKESSSTTKVRVVFNCSALDDTGLSLNDRVHRGPPLLSSISSLLINFRLFPVCLLADVKMMYRCVAINPLDRDNFVIAWRSMDDPNQHELYKMSVLTFGFKSAGWLAGRCIVELANLHHDEYPAAAETIKKRRYCDDFASGANDVESAKELRRQLTELLAKGGFEVRRWSSNIPEVLSDVPSSDLEKPIKLPTGEPGFKVLGVMWEQSSDSFVARVERFNSPIINKRICLSFISKIFDVMGIFSPTVFLAKHFMQRLWKVKGLNWDDALPDDLAEEWLTYTSDFMSLSEIKIPRYVPVIGAIVRLVGFADSSEKGMCAACYLHVESADNQIQSHLLMSKTKLAPLSTWTIPRLELGAFVLLCQLVKSIVDTFDLQFASITLYSDSKIVLSWLGHELHTMKIFVAHRISQIRQLVPNGTFGHVSGKANPADIGSRGMLASALKTADLWWHGPSFLRLSHSEWPGLSEEVPLEELPEMKPCIKSTLQVSNLPDVPKDIIIRRFSSLNRMQRVLVYVLRFVNNTKKKVANRVRGPVAPPTVLELEIALQLAVRVSQLQDFEDDIKLIKGNKLLNKQLRKLSPFVDALGLVRVGGRLSRADFLPESAKHPYLLSKGCHLSKLICDCYHKRLLHSGPRTTCSNIQKKFWILSLTSLVKKIIHRCTICHRLNAKPVYPKMADVLPDRMRMTYAWASCALDFGGPFVTKESNLRKSTRHKTYICVFVCLTSRAIHIEMVTDLTCDAFLAAYHRFTARRSVPNVIYSDRGTNFTSANTVLKECRDFLLKNHDTIFSAASAMGTQWKLHPPFGPNFNACAENGIKSCKALLKRQIGLQVLTFEQMQTLLCRVEQVLNSRPIVFSNDINDQDLVYITPGHLIVGREMMVPAEKPIDENVSVRDRFKLVQQMAQAFWKDWSVAYLHELMQREKWSKATESLKPNDIVYVMNVDTSPLSWAIGRVEQTFTNPHDSTVRVAKVRVRGRTLVRPVNKLIVIPTSDE